MVVLIETILLPYLTSTSNWVLAGPASPQIRRNDESLDHVRTEVPSVPDTGKWVTKKATLQNVPTTKNHHQSGRFVPAFESNSTEMRLFNHQHLSV
jgi:hypothetical protein